MTMLQKILFVLILVLSTPAPGFSAEKGTDFPNKPIKLSLFNNSISGPGFSSRS